jgi:long-subunit fatty acid transport protein
VKEKLSIGGGGSWQWMKADVSTATRLPSGTDGNRIIQLPADESFTLTAGIAHNASKTMTYSFGGAVVFYGDAEVKNQDTQGISFSGKFDTNVLFVLGGSLQLRF